MAGAKWVAENRPDWLRAAGALNECGGVSTTIAGRRFYPIQVAEKGFAAYRIAVRGTWGHGSMPRDDNAAVLAAAVIERLAVPGPSRVTPVMARFLELAAAELPGRRGRLCCAGLSGDDPRRAEAAIAVACDPMYARALRALLRDTISPDVVHAGIKYNVIPGDAVVEVDCRVLPGTTEPDDARRRSIERLGPELAAACEIELIVFGAPVEAPADGPLFDLLVGDDPRPRPGRHPAAGHGAVRDRREAHRRRSGRRPTASHRSGSIPTSGSSSGSTGSTSASRSTPCAGACRSSTTWSAASAADAAPAEASERGSRDRSARRSRVLGGCGPPRRTSCRRNSVASPPSRAPDRGRPDRAPPMARLERPPRCRRCGDAGRGA